MREIRTKLAPSASETTNVAATVGETEKQETSEDLEETTEIATVATETEASEESAVCPLCVTLKAKVVALQKKCSCLRQKAVWPSVERKPASVMSEEPSEDSSSHDKSEHSSEIRTDDNPPSQTSLGTFSCRTATRRRRQKKICTPIKSLSFVMNAINFIQLEKKKCELYFSKQLLI